MSISYQYAPAEGPVGWQMHLVKAIDGDTTVGRLTWGVGPDGKATIGSVQVDHEYRRQGIATEMLRRAREIHPDIQHNKSLTSDGYSWSQHVGSQMTSGDYTITPAVVDGRGVYIVRQHGYIVAQVETIEELAEIVPLDQLTEKAAKVGVMEDPSGYACSGGRDDQDSPGAHEGPAEGRRVRARRAHGSPTGRVTDWRPLRPLHDPRGLSGTPRRVTRSRRFNDDLADAPGDIRNLVEDYLDDLTLGQPIPLHVKDRGRGLGGTFTINVEDDGQPTPWRIGLYVTSHDDSWVIYWLGAHNYDEAEKRIGKVASTYTVFVGWGARTPGGPAGLTPDTHGRIVRVEADSDNEARMLAAQMVNGGTGGNTNPIVTTLPDGMVTSTEILSMEAKKTAASWQRGTHLYRGYQVTLPPDVLAEVERLAEPPMEESDIGNRQKIGPIILDYLMKGHQTPYGRVNLGRHWTSNRNMAQIAMQQGNPGGNRVGILLEALDEGQKTDPKATMQGQFYVDSASEQETNLTPGTPVTITGVYMLFYGLDKNENLLPSPVRKTASNRTVRFYHGTSSVLAEALRQSQTFRPIPPKEISDWVAEQAGIDPQKLWMSGSNAFSRSTRESDSKSYFTTFPDVAKAYAELGSEVLNDCLYGAARIIVGESDGPGLAPANALTRARDAWVTKFKRDHGIKPVVLTLDIPVDWLAQNSYVSEWKNDEGPLRGDALADKMDEVIERRHRSSDTDTWSLDRVPTRFIREIRPVTGSKTAASSRRWRGLKVNSVEWWSPTNVSAVHSIMGAPGRGIPKVSSSSRAGIEVEQVRKGRDAVSGVVAQGKGTQLAYRGFGSWGEARDAAKSGRWRSKGMFTVPAEGETQMALSLANVLSGSGMHSLRGTGFLGAIEADVAGLPFRTWVGHNTKEFDLDLKSDDTGLIRPDLGLGIGIDGGIPVDQIKRVYRIENNRVTESWTWSDFLSRLDSLEEVPGWEPELHSDRATQKHWACALPKSRPVLVHALIEDQSRTRCGKDSPGFEGKGRVSYRKVMDESVSVSDLRLPGSKTLKPCRTCYPDLSRPWVGPTPAGRGLNW